MKEVNLSDKFQRPHCQQLSLNLLSRVEAFKWNRSSLLWNTFSGYSCTRNGKAGWYETFRDHTYLAINSQKCRVLLIGDSIIVKFSKFSSVFDKLFSKFDPLNFSIGGDKIQNVLWRINIISLSPSPQYIFIHCDTNNIENNDAEVTLDGLITLARVVKKKYEDVKIIISSLLPKDKANSRKHSLAIATYIYLKEACNFNSFSFIEMYSGWILGSSLNTLIFKNDHLHLPNFGYEKLSLLLVSHLNAVFGKNSWNFTRTTNQIQIQISHILHLKKRRASAIIICLQSTGIIYWFS